MWKFLWNIIICCALEITGQSFQGHEAAEIGFTSLPLYTVTGSPAGRMPGDICNWDTFLELPLLLFFAVTMASIGLGQWVSVWNWAGRSKNMPIPATPWHSLVGSLYEILRSLIQASSS